MTKYKKVDILVQLFSYLDSNDMKTEGLPGAWVLESFRRGGVDLEQLSQQLPEDVDNLLYHMDTISTDCTNRLLLLCAELSNNPDFGLTMNERVDITMYGLFGYLLLNSSTVRDLLMTLERYYSIYHAGGVSFKIVHEKDTIKIRYCFDHAISVNSRHITEWALGFVACYLKEPLGEIAKPLSTHLSHGEPQNKQKLYSIFGEHIVFNEPDNYLIYPKSILNKPLSNVDPELLKILRKQADKTLKNYLKSTTFLHKIQSLLVERISGEQATAEAIAKEFNLTISTFKRRLVQEKINFRQVKEEVKNNRAKQLLGETQVSISDIARKTGYTDQSSFTRFFIRCNKITPKKFRKSHQK